MSPGSEPTVGALMATQLVTVREDAPLRTAALLLDEHHVHGLPVVDAEGALVGVISQTDLMRARATEHLWSSWPGLLVRHLMTRAVVTARRSTSVSDAVAIMERARIHRLIVVDDDGERPIGVFSTSDVIHLLAGVSQDA